MQPIHIALVIAAAAVSVSARNIVLPESVMRGLSSSEPISLTGNLENFRFPTPTVPATTTSGDAAQTTASATSVRKEVPSNVRMKALSDDASTTIDRMRTGISRPTIRTSATPDARATDV